MTATKGQTRESTSHAMTATGANRITGATSATAVAASWVALAREQEVPQRVDERRGERQRESGGRHPRGH